MVDPVRVEMHGSVALVLVDNPPVNAFSHHVRVALSQAFATLDADSSVRAIVFACAGKSFSAGADVRELGAAPIPPSMGSVMQQMDAARPLLIAAIHGQALGGGLEAALICDYRVASADARMGLPEINLGLIPGGGGTQRLPRLIGVGPAVDFILSGKPMDARTALTCGLIDEIADGDPIPAALALAHRLSDAAGAGRRLSEMGLDAQGFDFAASRAAAAKRGGAVTAAICAIDAVEGAATLPFSEGIAREAELFQKCRQSVESNALRYLFAAERSAGRIAGPEAPKPVTQVAVIGAGTMGSGVAIALLDAGLSVTLVDAAKEGLERGLGTIRRTYQSQVERGRIAQQVADERLTRLVTTLELQDAANVDLVIECVFEDMTLKQDLFRQLGALTRPGTILATNTSALDVNAIAAASGRPDQVVGMHFFSPANIMKLVEVVDAAQTSRIALATALDLAKRMGKIGVVSGVCDGFIGNRMIGGYLRQANMLLLEGALPEQIDAALQAFGMAMGPHAMGDLAGLDIQAVARRRRREAGVIPPDDPFGAVADRLVAEGRLGLKTGKGMYRYEEGSRQPQPDPAVADIIRATASQHAITQKQFTDEEIVMRCIMPLINEGARILEEGIALAASDIDVVYCNGYGFPRTRGGPMFYADTLGLDTVVARIEKYQSTLDPRHWELAPLLRKIRDRGEKLSAFSNRP